MTIFCAYQLKVCYACHLYTKRSWNILLFLSMTISFCEYWLLGKYAPQAWPRNQNRPCLKLTYSTSMVPLKVPSGPACIVVFINRLSNAFRLADRSRTHRSTF